MKIVGLNERYSFRIKGLLRPDPVLVPINGSDESILRLDHLQPIGAHHDAYKVSDYLLSESAIQMMDDMLRWLVWGGVPEDSMILEYRSLIEDFFEN